MLDTSQVPAVVGLSVLELCMLVAAQRLEDAGSCVFNFQVCVADMGCKNLGTVLPNAHAKDTRRWCAQQACCNISGSV
jgi:hypothetical protein